MTAALPMGGNKITGMADPTVSTDGSTKAYADALVASFFSTGDIKFTLKIVPDAGWLLFDDGTFGSASSGSSNSNSAANLALFTLLFNAPFTDANIPIFTSGGGATTRAAQVSASAAWAANCRMSLPKTLGRALAIAGSGSGLTARTPGQAAGGETVTLVANQLPSSIPFTDPGHVHSLHDPVNGDPLSVFSGGGTVGFNVSGANANGSLTVKTATTGITINPSGGQPTSVMQPTSFLNCMVKL